MPRRSTNKDFGHSLVSNSGVSIGPTATSIPVVDGSQFPDTANGKFTIRFPSTGEVCRVNTRTGNVFTSVTRGLPEGAAGTYSGTTLLDGTEVDEIFGAQDIADAEDYVPPIDGSNITSGTISSARLPANVSSIKKTGSAALTGDVTLTGGTNVTLTQAGQDISIAASASVSDATTSAVGVVEVDHAPSGAHPVALTTDGVAVPSGMLGTASTKAAAGNDSRFATNAGETTATDFKATGLTGATAASRYVGATASGAPVSGTFLTGDFIIDQAAHIYVCTAGGSPGTWAGLTGGSGSSTLAGDTDVSISSPASGDHLIYNGIAWVNKALLTTASAALAADVTMTTANTAYDGPSISLAAGTWLVWGKATLIHSGGQTFFTLRLWDGTTTVDEGEASNAAAALDIVIPVFGIVTPGTTTTFKITAYSAFASTPTMKAAATHNSGGNKATTIYALRVG